MLLFLAEHTEISAQAQPIDLKLSLPIIKVMSEDEKWKVNKKCVKLKNEKYLWIELVKVDISCS